MLGDGMRGAPHDGAVPGAIELTMASATATPAAIDHAPPPPATGGGVRVAAKGDGTSATGTRFRPDVEGLRAIAIVTVVAFHAGVPWLSGGFVGVDVFFVLSGFLISQLLVSELERTGRLSFSRFYARRVRRLLPLSSLVLVATAIVSHFVVASIDRPGIGGDIRAAALYVSNWHFAGQAVDYMAGDVAKSPILHYWSLAVEEQFYLVWPLLLLALGWRRARHGGLPRRRIALGVGIVGVASFAASVYVTGSDPVQAYYSSFTRAWELAAGALLALAIHRATALPRLAAELLAGAGAVLVLGSTLLISVTTPFPGTAAAFPVLGTVLLVLAGGAASRPQVSAVLGLPLLRFIGRISYAWYLWHWPCLVLARARFGPADADTGGEAHWYVLAGAVVVSLVLAIASHYAIENPVRHARALLRSPRRTLALGGVLTVVPLFAVAGLLRAPAIHLAPGQAARVPTKPYAATARFDGGDRSAIKLAMTPSQTRHDFGTRLGPCRVNADSTVVASPCLFGDPRGSRTIVLLGDSHAYQLQPAFDALGKARHWKVYVWGKDSCSMTDSRPFLAGEQEYTTCETWREQVLAHLATLGRIDQIVLGRSGYVAGNVLGDDGSPVDDADLPAAWEASARSMFGKLARLAPKIVVVGDTLRGPRDIPRCLAQNLADPAQCDFPRAKAIYPDAGLLAAEARAADGLPVRFADLTPALCPAADATCPAVTTDGVPMYRDSAHLTQTFAGLLARVVGRALDRATPQPPSAAA